MGGIGKTYLLQVLEVLSVDESVVYWFLCHSALRDELSVEWRVNTGAIDVSAIGRNTTAIKFTSNRCPSQLIMAAVYLACT